MVTSVKNRRGTWRLVKDRFEFAIDMLAYAVIIYMFISIFYLYFAVGGSWDLVGKALLDNRVIGSIIISISSAFIVGGLAVAIAIPTAYFLVYRNFRGKSMLET
ncbi:MAG: hypothetical protein QXX08_01155 [Candidatus Bathyarchaeia archaeon]